MPLVESAFWGLKSFRQVASPADDVALRRCFWRSVQQYRKDTGGHARAEEGALPSTHIFSYLCVCTFVMSVVS